MANVVIKKDGREEPFDEEKLRQSIRVNAIDATLAEAEEKTNNLVSQISTAIIQSVQGKEKITVDELREKILSELDKIAPKVAKTWREFDQEAGKA